MTITKEKQTGIILLWFCFIFGSITCFKMGSIDLNKALPTPSDDLFKGAPPIQYSTLSGPSFNRNVSTNHATVVAGSTAILNCAIKNLHNFTVSWVRSKDTRLLTIGTTTYTSDKRFVASNPKMAQQWILRIHYARLEDSGSYLCQVSTTPPIMLTVNLTVVEALLRVKPGKESHVQLGSRLELICEVEGCRGSPILTWTHNGKQVKHDSSTISRSNYNNSPLSKLSLVHQHAVAKHSGKYTCSSSCLPQLENVTVHVLKGEELAAMQHHNLSCRIGGHLGLVHWLALLFTVLNGRFLLDKRKSVYCSLSSSEPTAKIVLYSTAKST